jgi:hypothetical protein
VVDRRVRGVSQELLMKIVQRVGMNVPMNLFLDMCTALHPLLSIAILVSHLTG